MFYDYEVRELEKVCTITNKLEGYKKYILLSLIRRAMIRKLPYSRMNIGWNKIKLLRDEEYSYEKYKRKRAYHNWTFEKHIKENIDLYNNAVFDNNKENKSFNMDAFKLYNEIQAVDIIYMDPPYPDTMNKYEDFYGVYDNMFGKEIPITTLNIKNTFLKKFEELISIYIYKTKYMVISLNNKNEDLLKDLKEMLKKYGVLTIKEKEHQYKVTGKENKNINKEYLFILECKED